MKKSLLSLRGLLTAAIAIITFGANATVWDFTTLGATDKNNLDADKTNWTYDSDNGRWGNSLVLSKQILTANGQELDFTKGLQVSAAKANQVRIDPKKGCFTINNSAATITIPSLRPVTISQCWLSVLHQLSPVMSLQVMSRLPLDSVRKVQQKAKLK